MTEKELIRRFKKDYKSLFPKIWEATLDLEPTLENGKRVDLCLRLAIKGGEKILFCEVTAQGYPKQLREKGVHLIEITGRKKTGYPVIVAPYISELGRDTCKKLGI